MWCLNVYSNEEWVECYKFSTHLQALLNIIPVLRDCLWPNKSIDIEYAEQI